MHGRQQQATGANRHTAMTEQSSPSKVHRANTPMGSVSTHGLKVCGNRRVSPRRRLFFAGSLSGAAELPAWPPGQFFRIPGTAESLALRQESKSRRGGRQIGSHAMGATRKLGKLLLATCCGSIAYGSSCVSFAPACGSDCRRRGRRGRGCCRIRRVAGSCKTSGISPTPDQPADTRNRR